LHAIYAGGRAQFNAYLDDHAFLLQACIECLQARWDASILAFAHSLADAILNHFEDAQSGGYFFTRHDHETLITRPRIVHDAATASGYSVAVRALLNLGHLTGESRYLKSAEQALISALAQARQRPAAFSSLMLSLETHLIPPRVIVLRGSAPDIEQWSVELAQANLPYSLVLAIPTDTQDLPEALNKPAPYSGVNAWVCQGVQCLPEITELSTLLHVCKSPEAVG